MRKSAIDIAKQRSNVAPFSFRKKDVAQDNGLMFSTKSYTGGKSYFAIMRIGASLAKKAGFAAGDDVKLEFDDETGDGWLEAVPKDEGWVLISANQKSESPPLVLRITWRPSMPSIAIPELCKNVIAGSRRLRFKFPESTSFTALAQPVEVGGGKKVEKVVKAKEVKEEKKVESRFDELYDEHKELIDKERLNKKARKHDMFRRECDNAPMMRDGKPYGRRATDVIPHQRRKN